MPVKGPVVIRTVAPTGTASSAVTGKPELEHGVDLPEVACQCLLINDFDHANQPVAAQREQAVVGISVQEHVTREERDNRLDFPPLGRATFFQYLGKVIDDPLGSRAHGPSPFLVGALCASTTRPPRHWLAWIDGSSHKFGGLQSGSAGRIGITELGVEIEWSGIDVAISIRSVK